MKYKEKEPVVEEGTAIVVEIGTPEQPEETPEEQNDIKTKQTALFNGLLKTAKLRLQIMKTALLDIENLLQHMEELYNETDD